MTDYTTTLRELGFALEDAGRHLENGDTDAAAQKLQQAGWTIEDYLEDQDG